MKTPEQQAQEWVTSKGYKNFIRQREGAYLAGHAAGKQEAEQRIWAKFVSWMTGPPDDRRLRIVSDELKRIIFGDEKV